jgi:hypothetical protein
LIILLAFSCGQNSSEKKLNGKWYELENEYATWEFYSDSLIVGTEFKDKFEWDASNSEIEIDYITYVWDSIGRTTENKEKIVIDYELNIRNDSLFGILTNKYGKHQFNLIKADKYNDYLQRKFDINFSLPKINESELDSINENYGIKIFMGFSNNKMIGKTELSNSLNNLENDIRNFKNKLKTDFEPEDVQAEFLFHLSVYADEKIADSVITASLPATIRSDIFNIYDFPKPPNNTMSIKIYRMYQNKDEANINLRKAKKIKTIANTVYN